MSKDFDSLTKLFGFIEEKVRETLHDDVLEKVKDVEQKKIQEEVYDAYKPTEGTYIDRRYSNGGLMDRDNIRIEQYTNRNGEQSIFIKNMTGGNPLANPVQDFTDAPNYLAGIIEHGRYVSGGNAMGVYTKNKYNTQYNYLKPRPFTYETIRELDRTLAHLHALKLGLKKRGIETD